MPLSTLGSPPSAQIKLNEIPTPSGLHGTAMNVQFGRPIPPQQQILLYSPDDWEEFIREWVHSQRSKYTKVLRFGGANDMGIDVAGLIDEKGLNGVWVNFQCKHYDKPLTPSCAAVEIGKILWHSFNKHYSAPKQYYFVAPKGCGTSLSRLLINDKKLKDYLITNWVVQCSAAITSIQTVTLDGDFEKYVNTFDFSIFSDTSLLSIIDDHKTTPYHAIRFGGGLPQRPQVMTPPTTPSNSELRYIQQLFEAYSDHVRIAISSLSGLTGKQDLIEHFHRQRECFYHAESLRNFARETVPNGTYENLKNEIYAGVADTESASHDDAYYRLNAVTNTATQLQLTSNPLISAVKIQDRKGICHQLANEDRLHWKK